VNGQFLMGVMCGVGVCWVLGAGFVLGVLGWLAGKADVDPQAYPHPHPLPKRARGQKEGQDADRL